MSSTPNDLSPLKRALVELRAMRAKLEALERERREPIAIVGIGCRFPGGICSPRAFWDLLREGKDATVEVPTDRWDVNALYDPDPEAPGKISTREGGFLERIDLFDAAFFGITPREAASMDPQQRLLLEVSFEALEDAGVSPTELRGKDVGVFVGIGTNDYLQLRSRAADLSAVDAYLATGTSHSVASGRLAFFYGFEGPCLSVDTACSSSLVAVHLAIQSLRAFECSTALACGVNAIAAPDLSVNFSRARMLAGDGRCKTFSAAADGYARGEGCGVVVLKRLGDALRDRDRIYAVVRGSAINQDGRSSGLTVPNGPAQEALLRRALESAGIAPDAVDYVEAHGTGTSLGDPIEAQALGAVFAEGRARERPLLLGSVKTNLGHLEAASGIAGLIKTALAFESEEIPPHLHAEALNPRVDWAALPLEVCVRSRSWKRGERPRFAGVSSFGFSGTNAHVVLGEAPVPEASEEGSDRALHVLAISARSEGALATLAERYGAHLLTCDDDFRDVCFTAGVGRSHFEHRLAVVARSRSEASRALASDREGERLPGVFRGRVSAGREPEVAFLFTGQGAQYQGMGRTLYETSPVFRESLERCDAILRAELDASLLDVLYGEETEGLVDRTGWTQPALFSIEYALAMLWRSLGIEPTYVFGHSVGEYVAACLASVFDLETGLRLVAERGRRMECLPERGAMTAVFDSEERVREALKRHPSVALAAVNGASNVVISGEREAVAAVEEDLHAEGLSTRALRVSHAFHSPFIDPALDPFESYARGLHFNEPRLALVTGVTGRLAEPGEITEASYWRRQTRETVRFAAAVETLRAEGVTIFLEIGPSAVLSALGSFSATGDECWLSSLRKGLDDWESVLASLARLYVRGTTVSFSGLEGGEPRRRVRLPTYPFERERYWIEIAGLAPAPRERDFDAVRDAARREAQRSGTTELVASYREKWRVLDELGSRFAFRALQELGWFLRPGDEGSVDGILASSGIRQGYRNLLDCWLERLASEGVLQENGSSFTLVHPPSSAEAKDPLERAREVFGEDRALVDYVERSGEALAAVLVGKESPLELLFPGGSFEAAEDIYERQPVSRYFHGILAAAVAELAGRRNGSRLEVLEIGAGTGSATSSVLPTLRPAASRYFMTDVSDLFLTRASEKFASFPFVVYTRFDIERDPEEQEIPLGVFDLVIAANVLHATKHLGETIGRVRELLAPGGLLLLCEGTTDFFYQNVSYGLIEGWRSFEDEREATPLRSRSWWESSLLAAGFDAVESFPSDDAVSAVLGQNVILARRDSTPVRGSRHAPIEALARSTSAPPRSTAKPVARGRREELARSLPSERVSTLVGFVREEIAAVMRTSLDRAPERLDPLKDRGVDSLMAIELRNRLETAFELEGRLPATLIFEHPTVQAVAELLATELEEPAEAAEPVSRTDNLESLSEEEAEALLLRKLESL